MVKIGSVSKDSMTMNQFLVKFLIFLTSIINALSTCWMSVSMVRISHKFLIHLGIILSLIPK